MNDMATQPDTRSGPDTTEIDNAISASTADQIEQWRKGAAAEFFARRKHLTLGDVAKFCGSPEYGDLIKSISLGEILALNGSPEGDTAPAPTAKTKRTSKAGNRRAKFDRDEVYTAIIAHLKNAKEPQTRAEVAAGIGYNDDQTRAFLKEMKKKKLIKASGAAASTRYHL